MRNFVISAVIMLTLVFFISAYIGYSYAKLEPGLEEGLKQFFESFKGFLNNPLVLMLIIFANNAAKALIAMLAGFYFGIFPVVFVALNGYIVGAVISLREPEMGTLGVVMALLPHGVLEIPAIILACSYGVWLGYRFYKALFNGEEFKPYLMHALKVYVKIILPVLFVAAFVEAFITPLLVFHS